MILKSWSLNFLEPSGPDQGCNGIGLTLGFIENWFWVLNPVCLYSKVISLLIISVRSCVPQVHSAAGRNKSMKNRNDTNGNRNRVLPSCIAVPQPTVLSDQSNHLTPNGHFSGRTAQLTYRGCIFYLFNRYTYWIF